jgi:hypothetical protein
VLNFSEIVVVGSEHKQCAKPRTVNLTILSNGVIHKIGRRKTLLHVVSEGTGVITVNKKNSQQQLIQSYATNVYDRNATNFDVK